MDFNIQYTDENLHSNTGLSILSKLLDSVCPNSLFDSHDLSFRSTKHAYSDRAILFTYLGLLLQGHTHYENVDLYKSDKLFKKSLGLTRVPSKETLRQRFDELGSPERSSLEALKKWNFELLEKYCDPLPIKETSMIPVDFDVTVMDNTGSKKEGVAQTYRPKIKGYAPMMTNIGSQGYLLNHEFRKGNAHSNCTGTLEYILESMSYARRLCPHAQLLARFDSGNDSEQNIIGLSGLKKVNYIIKHHLKGRNVQSSKATLIEYVMNNYVAKEEIEKNTVRYFAEQPFMAGMYDEDDNFVVCECRRILSVIELNTDMNTGEPLLIPYRSLHMWRTNLPIESYSPKRIIELYKDHGTSEQFHSEFKTDLDIERLPSSKFNTNALFVSLAQIVFNLLRIIGNEAVKLDFFSCKGRRKRIRIRSVILKIVLLPSKLIRKNKRWTISLPRSNPLSKVFHQLYLSF